VMKSAHSSDIESFQEYGRGRAQVNPLRSRLRKMRGSRKADTGLTPM